MNVVPVIFAIGLLAGSAVAETTALTDGVFTYEAFEHSVDHADLETCPEGINDDAFFCRVTLAAEAAHVFVFSYDGDQPLTEIRSFSLDSGVLDF